MLTQSQRPNILFLMTDQHNARCLGHRGHPDVKTPNIDALAANGVCFDNAFCQNGVCVPSRVSYHTGMYLHSHGVFNGTLYNPIPSGLLSLPAYLKNFGYQTACIGKKHLPGWGTVGYDYERLCYCDDAPTRNLHYYNYLKSHNLHAYYDDLGDVEKFCLREDGDTIPLKHSLETWTAREANRYLDEVCDLQKPFFLHVSFERPHPPLTVPKECDYGYDSGKITLPANDREVVQEEPIYFNRNVEMKWCKSVHGEKVLRQALCCYYNLITLIDEKIGEILQVLKKKNLFDDTLIIFCSDHGDYAGEYSKMAKGFCYDAIHRVPYIWRFGNKFASRIEEGLVQTIDMFPTLCDILNIPVPCQVQGVSLKDVLLTPNGHSKQDRVFYEFVGVKTVRTKKFKLNYCIDRVEKGELFDLEKDPYEYENVFNAKRYLGTRDMMVRYLLEWLITTQQPDNYGKLNERYPKTRWFGM